MLAVVGHGAVKLESLPSLGSAASAVEDCKHKCEEHPISKCAGIVVPAGANAIDSNGNSCILNSQMDTTRCLRWDAYNAYVRLLVPPSPPVPPAPPLLPPLPPRSPHAAGIDGLNAAFRKGRPSNDPSEIGVLMHMWDGQEDHVNGAAYKACIEHCGESLMSQASSPRLQLMQ